MSHCQGAVSTTLRQVIYTIPNYTYLLCHVNPACPINTASGHTYLIYHLSSQRQHQGATPMAVDTTAIVTGAPSRNVPKTIEGQWQAVKPPWGRHRDTEPDNLSVTVYLNNKPMSL